MTDAEQTEYLGMAAALGRVMMSLKQTEAALAEAQKELVELKKGQADSAA